MLDELWEKYDYDKNGVLEKEECRDFIKEIGGII